MYRQVILSVFTVLLFLASCMTCTSATIHDDTEHIIRQSYREVQLSSQKTEANGCTCVKNNCGCCQHIKIKKIKLNETVCANVSYLPDQYGINLAVTAGERRLINITVSAKNPPPVCVGLPHLMKAASLCVDFYNLDWANKTFSGCIKLEGRLAFVVVESIDFGCFHIPLGRQVPRDLIELVRVSRLRHGYHK